MNQKDQLLMKPSLDTWLRWASMWKALLYYSGHMKQQKLSIGTVVYAAKGKQGNCKFSRVQCYSCKEYSHIAKQYKKKIFNYCKGMGHIIKECRKCPQNRDNNCIYHAYTSISAPATSKPTTAFTSAELSTASSLTP